jgi:hypothetical protein
LYDCDREFKRFCKMDIWNMNHEPFFDKIN